MNNLFLVDIDCRWSEAKCDSVLPTLPTEAQARAARYLSAQARRNLIVTQHTLHKIIDCLGIDVSKLAVCPQGRPYLKDCPLQFNLSHSEDRAVLALALDSKLKECLGVDMEWVERRVERDALAKRFFTAEEFQYTLGKTWNFFEVWTRKEAVLKSNGVGLRVELDSFSVLNDKVEAKVTGRSLKIATTRLDSQYIASWAVCQAWGDFQVHWVAVNQRDWLNQLAEGIKA